MSDTARLRDSRSRYPKLVSFVGVTNAGKSTIVKMLIQCGVANHSDQSPVEFPSPVVGSVVDDSRTTSRGVNLYADPTTVSETIPIYYADCEGFEGGEQPPLGSQPHQDPQSRDDRSRAWINTRRIRWADREEYRGREYAVTVLYPRLLYSFSDCVVFVLRNPKTFGSAALTKLLDWGAAALEKSINQPALPHCVVTLNGSHPGIDPQQWESQQATQTLLDSVNNAFDRDNGVPQFRRLADHWRGLGKEINTIRDLILCYYASFKVIRIPEGQHYTLIGQQVNKLRNTIRTDCDASHESKRYARLLTNADELNLYLQSGFDHFTTHIDVPFNFMQVSLRRNPIPRDFGGHILQLCETLSPRIPSRDPEKTEVLFEKLSLILASCVLLDCTRFRKGQLYKLFASYAHFFESAVAEYLQLHCPCSFVSPDGTRTCRLVKARHEAKGHQDERGIIAAGHHITTLDSGFARRWMRSVETTVFELHKIFSRELERSSLTSGDVACSEESIAFDIHVRRLNAFYRSIGPATWVRSHATCYCCLIDVPQHPLPCGHALCDKCARACGELSESTLLVSWCPLHRDATRWSQPKEIKYRPQGAGVRVLALDGGGIRGVVQLEILRAIEQALGGHLPVQAFFDLLVGTGTGGLIATALAKEGMTLDRCQDVFGRVCRQAFTKKTPGGALINHVGRALGSRPQYERSAVYGILQSEFSDDKDFFGEAPQFLPDVKVALTATNMTTQKTTLLSNYRRPGDENASSDCDVGAEDVYDYDRPHDPAKELKTWQAVYATMADPRYFAPLSFGRRFSGSDSTSVNLPSLARTEACKIWPEAGEPDLLLSLGTGQNRMAILGELLTDSREGSSLGHDRWFRGRVQKAQRFTKWWLRSDNDVLDAERMWQAFCSEPLLEASKLSRRRRVRFNVDLGKEEPPAQDRESQIQRLSTLVRDKLQEDHRHAAVTNVAHRLIATSFYYAERARRVNTEGKQYTIGRISCRFDNHTDKIKRLGRLLGDRCQPGFEPYFTTPPVSDGSISRIRMTPDRLSTMVRRGVFELPEIEVHSRGEPHTASIQLHLLPDDRLEPQGYSISGMISGLGESGSPNTASNTAATPRMELQPATSGPVGEEHSGQRLPSSPNRVHHQGAIPIWKDTAIKSPSEESRRSGHGKIASDAAACIGELPPPYDAGF